MEAVHFLSILKEDSREKKSHTVIPGRSSKNTNTSADATAVAV